MLLLKTLNCVCGSSHKLYQSLLLENEPDKYSQESMNIDPKKVKTTGFDDMKFVSAFVKSRPNELKRLNKGEEAVSGVDDDKQERNNPEYFRNKLYLLKNSTIVEVKDLVQKLSNMLRYCSVELVVLQLLSTSFWLLSIFIA